MPRTEYGSDLVPDRWWAKICPEPNTGCWLWTGWLDHEGYGRGQHLKVAWLVHRFMYVQFCGPVPEGLELDHLCRTRSCVNPEHLEAVTHEENMRRGHWAIRTHCSRGHLLPDRRPGSRRRVCRECFRITGQAPHRVAAKKDSDRRYRAAVNADPTRAFEDKARKQEWERKRRAAMTDEDRARQAERVKQAYAERKHDPEYMANKRARERARHAARMSDPLYVEHRRKYARELAAKRRAAARGGSS